MDKIEVRRPSLFIFLIILSVSIFIISKDLKNIDNTIRYVDDFEVKIQKIETKNNIKKIYCKDVIIDGNILDNYEVGDILKVKGELKSIFSKEEMRYALYLKSKGYSYEIKAYEIKKANSSLSFYFFIYKIREHINSIIDFLYIDYYPIIRALVTADRSLIDKEDILLFSRAGISHIISISGFHILLISGVFFNLFFFLDKNKRYLISLFITFFYVAIIGFNPASLRAYIFYLSYVFSVFYGKRYDIFSVGFLLSSFYMVLNPYIIFDYGFCLSFISVFSIAMFYNKLFIFIKKYIKIDKLDFLFSLVCITISSQILSIPYIYYNFGVISTISILSNLITVPIIAYIYPFILSSIIFVKLPFIRDVLVNIVDISMLVFYKSNQFLISFKYSYINFEDKNILLIFIFYFIILIFYSLLIQLKIKKNFNCIDKFDI